MGVAAGLLSKLFGGSGAPETGASASAHRSPIPDRSERVAAVQQDVLQGSGISVSPETAAKMLYSVEFFTGTGYSRIRNAYEQPDADARSTEAMRALDDYLRAAPKWEGRVYRGINVSRETAEELLSGKPIDMHGPASWSSDQGVAESFSDGYRDVRIVFEMEKNKSGVSVTHIGSCGDSEAEVLAPSGIRYTPDRVRRVQRGKSEIIYIDVHE